MNILKKIVLSGASFVLLLGLAACEKPGPAESAGKKLDEATSEASKKIESSVDKVTSEIKKQTTK